MMRRTLCLLGCALLLGSCGGRNETGNNPVENSGSASSAYWNRPRKIPLTSQASDIAGAWPAFSELDRSFDVLSRSASEEELKLAIKDLIEKEQNLVKQPYPTAFDRVSIKSRQKVMTTYMLKLQWQLDNRDSVSGTVDALSDAYNAMRLQLNVTLKYPLDSLQNFEK